MKLSKNQKLNNVLNYIYNELLELGVNEVNRYKKEFPNELDFNIAQYGNLTIYYSDIRDIYKNAGYKSIDTFSNEKVWETYKRQVGYIAKHCL